MTPQFDYVHAIDGRLRIKVPEVKRSTAHARQVEALFRPVEGIALVRANPITGNVLFLHDPDRVATREIMAILIAAGYMGMGADADRVPVRSAGDVAAIVADLICRVLFQAWRGFNPGQDLLERVVEAAARFLLRFVLGRVAVAVG